MILACSVPAVGSGLCAAGDPHSRRAQSDSQTQSARDRAALPLRVYFVFVALPPDFARIGF
eukprot:5422768-Prymnesium_polylepis.2